jgi:hypothetical protein
MSTQIALQSYTFRDAKGYTWTLKHNISYSDASVTEIANGRVVAQNVLAALRGLGPGTLPLTNGVWWRVHGPFDEVNIALAYGTAAQYLNAEDKLNVTLLDTAGSLHRFGIGCPVIAAFLADQETGQASQLVDFMSAMTTPVGVAFACNKAGQAFTTTVVGSTLIRRRQRRKVNLLTKSSNLDEPGE